jgi:NhaP-type Na+/H+ or K+/H+ antiporter
MTLNYHHVKRVIASSNIIAVPGALLCFYLIALCIKHILAYSAWDFTLCLVVGSILCASDPVSVINLLKEISTGSNSSIRLTYFIELEALLNDGIALVLFEILTIKHTTVNEYVIYFIRVIFISPLIGIALGLGNIALLHMFQQKISVTDIYIQIVSTVICAYLTFFIAHYILGVSGIIACCAAGVTFSYYGKPLILKEELMHGFWGTLEFICNTLIFLLSGLIVGYKSVQYVHYADIGSIFIIYILMNIIRFVTLLICHYPISKLILDYDFRHSIFVAFSGIKGSMSLLLAILLESHTIEDSSDTYAGDKLFPKADVDRAVFVICGVVTCTLVFNGFLVGSVLQWLNLIEKNSEHDELMLSFVKLRLIKTSRELVSSYKRSLPKDVHDFLLSASSILKRENNNSNSMTPQNSKVEINMSPDTSKWIQSPDNIDTPVRTHSLASLTDYVRGVANIELAKFNSDENYKLMPSLEVHNTDINISRSNSSVALSEMGSPASPTSQTIEIEKNKSIQL